MFCDWYAYVYAPNRLIFTDEGRSEVHCGAELTMRQWNDPAWVVFQDREDDDKATAVVVDENNWGIGAGIGISWPPSLDIGFSYNPTGSGYSMNGDGFLFNYTPPH